MNGKEYKDLSLKEFTRAAEVYETDKAGVYKMCEKDYPDVLEELEKEPFEDLLDVLGYGKGEIRSMILSSNHLIVPIGFLLGVSLGIAISDMIAAANAQTSGMFMTIELTPDIFLTGMLFVGTAYFLSMLLAGRKLRTVDMVECLKEDRE